MPNRRPRPHGPGKWGPDGLTDRERAFALELRKDPTMTYEEAARRAGFLGNARVLQARARVMVRKAAVRVVMHAPAKPEDVEIDEDKLKDELRRTLLAIVRGSADNADKIRAIDKLLCTVPGGYVPVQVDMKNTLSMEKLVRAMGGAPDESPALTQGADA